MRHLILLAMLTLSSCATVGASLKGMGQAMKDAGDASKSETTDCTTHIYGSTANTRCR